ncbi:galactose oxidase [Paramuricea clavata]|uniref:Galactose oxidase n=1 Tax=Paramuricea clavata TaxID=317549 RepID=A0A6S7GIB2_PARCT|nr:galactose oxidase [Paramuricea clavata]
MRQQFEKMMIMVQQALPGSNVNNNGAQAIDPAVPANNQDIIILGGSNAPGVKGVSNTVEKYSIVEGKSSQLPGMNLARRVSASCVYNGSDSEAGTDSIEILKMNQHPLRWTMFDAKLPVKLSAHDVTVYQNKLYIIGGHNWNEDKSSDAIYELSLAPPYIVKLLARMPQPRRNHRAEIVNGKLFILGGSTTDKSKDATDSVVVYDFIKNEIKPCPSLPEPVSEMSSVTWGNMIIVVGGLHKNNQDLNDVIMYHIETGRSDRLPSLKHNRRGASAVTMHDVIVVLGGANDEEGNLNSVESFTMGDDQWKELPGMKEKKYYATAAENVDEIRESQDVINVKVDQIQENVDVMKQTQDVINVKVNKMKENVDEMKQTQAEMKADQMAFEAEVRNQFQRMTEMLNQLHGRNITNNAAQALDPPVPDNNQDIIILGGIYAPGLKSVSNTVEKFNIAKGKSIHLPKLNRPRAESASCVYNGDVIITGGFDGKAGTDSIEILKINQDPLRWMFDGKLPVKLSAHDVTVYQDKLYVMGGYNWNENKTNDQIYERSIIPPYTAKPLATMPQPTRYHRAEIVNGKLFTLGGTTTDLCKDAIDNVVVYDFIKNEFKSCRSLPKPVCDMSTVTWGNMIILIGGQDKNDQVLNDVYMYDTGAEQRQNMPPLIHKRTGSSAVIMHDVIVVLGGWNKEEGYLNSVESFTMGDDHWRELSGIKEKRYFANAVVEPRN